jgi:CheY-like chemotaxis protein
MFIDVLSNRKMLKMLFKRRNFITEMSEAQHGKQAVDMVLANMDLYQLIFMDNLMPQMVSLK